MLAFPGVHPRAQTAAERWEGWHACSQGPGCGPALSSEKRHTYHNRANLLMRYNQRPRECLQRSNGGPCVSPDLVSLITTALQDLTEQEDLQVPAHVSSETSLFGHDGLLDSLGLVTLVVAVEQAIEDTYGVSVSLADERAMSQRHSPYRTVGSLAEYAGRMLQVAQHDG